MPYWRAQERTGSRSTTPAIWSWRCASMPRSRPWTDSLRRPRAQPGCLYSAKAISDRLWRFRSREATMRWSEERILTTHAGSLPRPPELVRLYARRARGEAVDPATLETAGRQALSWVVPKQIEAGVDVGNNGEQQREGFFLYVQHRMSGFGGSWQRRQRGDAARYPVFERMMQEQLAGRTAVSNMHPPKAIGAIRYLDPAAVHAECDDFRAALDAADGGFVEPFLTAPSPGIVAAAIKNEHYDTEEAYLEALADALKVEYEAIVGHGFLLQLDCPDLALERHITYQDRPLADFLGFVERVVSAINRALARVPRDRVRLHVCWGNYEGPHDLDVSLAEILPIIRQANVGGFVFPFANPRHAHEYHCFEAGGPGGPALDDDQVLVAGVIDT